MANALDHPDAASLRTHFDGETLVIDGAGLASIAIDIDGLYFADMPIAHADSIRFSFSFSPSGHARLHLQLRVARDGPTIGAPLSIELGKPGIAADSEPPAPLPLAPPAAGEWMLPFASDALAAQVAIIIPVFNAVAALGACLESVAQHSDSANRVIVIDDASDDPAVRPILARYADRAGWSLLRNERNLGFTATVNRGMREAVMADVVLLNADTEVAANWLIGLRRAALSRGEIGSVTAVSDNAGAFSVPELEQANPFPAGWSFSEAAAALWQGSGLAYPLLPTGNGFCMYIKRRVLDAVGLFDAEAFAQGYGEENDFCQRAEAAGYIHAIAGNVLVRHVRSQSFGHERRAALGAAGMRVLRERWPNYENAVGASLFSFERRVLDWRVRRSYAGEPPRGPRVLRLVAAPGTTQSCNGEEIWYAARDHDDVVLLRCNANASIACVERAPACAADAPARLLQHRQALWEWLQRYAIERVEIIDGDAHPADCSTLAAKLGIRCVNVPRRDGSVAAVPRSEP